MALFKVMPRLGTGVSGLTIDGEIVESEVPIYLKQDQKSDLPNQIENLVIDNMMQDSSIIPPQGCIKSNIVLYNNEIHVFGGSNNSNREHYKYDGNSWILVSSDLPNTAEYRHAVIYNNEIHLLYGNNHYKFDGSSWVSVSTIPVTLSNYATVVIHNNEIHVVGCYTNPRTQHYKWDGSTWISVSTLPYPANANTFSVIVYKGEMHLLGGNVSPYYTQHHKLDGNQWVSVSTLPYMFYNGSAVVYNNEIHLIGCYGNYNRKSHSKWDGISWTVLPDLISNYDTRNNGGAIIYDEMIYVIGGTAPFIYKEDLSNNLKYKHIMNMINSSNFNIFNIIENGINISVAGGGAPYPLVCNDELYICGGGKSTYQCCKWNGTSWNSVSVMPSHNLTPLVYKNEIHFIGNNGAGGYHYKYSDGFWVEASTFPNSTLGTTYTKYVVYKDEIHGLDYTRHYKWDGKNSEWILASTIPYQFRDGVATVYDNEIHILGSNTSPYTQHYKWDGTSWTSVSTSPGRYIKSVVVYNNEIHIFGTNVSPYTQHYKWNGSSWVVDFDLPDTCSSSYATRVVVFNNELHCFDYYTNHYKWNGTNWVIVSELAETINSTRHPIIRYNNEIHDLYMNNTTLPYNKITNTGMTQGILFPSDIGFSPSTAVVYNNELHILGSAKSPYTQHYKLNGQEWESVSTLPHTSLNTIGNGCSLIYNDELHILGTSNEHYKWNGTSWSSVSTLPYNLRGGCAVVYNDEIHILGSYSTSPYTQHYKWNGNTWISVSTLPFALRNGTAVAYKDGIYIMGSSTVNCYKWDGISWTSVNTFPFNFTGTALVYDGEIHTVGSQLNNYIISKGKINRVYTTNK